METRKKTVMNPLRITLAFLPILAMGTVAFAMDVVPERDDYDAPKKEYSPYVDDHFPNNVYFGDTHLHTSWSADIGMAGATLGPEEAYRVSRGETVTEVDPFLETVWRLG